MDLRHTRITLNPQLKTFYANIIKRTLKRLVMRNKVHDKFNIIGPPSPDKMTLYGQSLLSIPRSCIITIWHKNWLYWFDVRELVQYMCTTIGGTLSNPYNGKPFSLYQKYYILRKFYRSTKQCDYVPLEVTDVQHVYTTPQNTINAISEILDMKFLKEAPLETLYDLMNQLVCYYNETKTHYQTLNWIQYHYCQGNEEMFRYHLCILIQKLFDSSTDQENFAIMVRQRIANGRNYDPISYVSTMLNIMFMPQIQSITGSPDPIDNILDFGSNDDYNLFEF